jgi:hypothetical protein
MGAVRKSSDDGRNSHPVRENGTGARKSESPKVGLKVVEE